MTLLAKSAYPFLFDIIRDWMNDEFHTSDFEFNRNMGVAPRHFIEWSQYRNGFARFGSEEFADTALSDMGPDAVKLWMPDEMGGDDCVHARAYLGTQLISALAEIGGEGITENQCAQHLEELAAILPIITYWITHG